MYRARSGSINIDELRGILQSLGRGQTTSSGLLGLALRQARTAPPFPPPSPPPPAPDCAWRERLPTAWQFDYEAADELLDYEGFCTAMQCLCAIT